MSRYALPAVTAANTDLVNSAEIGLENRVFYSLADTKYLGKLEQDAAGNGTDDTDGTLTLDPAYSAPASYASGYDVQATLRNAMVSPDGAFEAELNCTFAGGTITGVTSASPGVITTSAAHGLTNGDLVNITGVTGAGATGVNGTNRTVTVISPTTFSVAITTSGAGTGGSFAVQGKATITYEPPSHVSDQGFSLPLGLALDVVGDGGNAGRQIRTIDSIEVLTNGGAGTKIEFYALPESNTYIELGCVEDKNITLPSPEPIRIPCGDQAARWTKMGRETDPALTLSSKHRNFAEGLLRLNGLRHTLKIEVRKDKRILSERLVFVDVIGSYSVEKGDGNALSMDRCTAIFSSVLAFV